MVLLSSCNTDIIEIGNGLKIPSFSPHPLRVSLLLPPLPSSPPLFLMVWSYHGPSILRNLLIDN